MGTSLQSRFSQLFAVKAKFKLEELEPYVRDLFDSSSSAGTGMPRSQAEVLLKYTKMIDGLYYPAHLAR